VSLGDRMIKDLTAWYSSMYCQITNTKYCLIMIELIFIYLDNNWTPQILINQHPN